MDIQDAKTTKPASDLRESICESKSAIEDTLSAVVKNMNEGVGIVQDNRFVYVNDSVCRITGYSRDELIGMCYLNLVPADQKGTVAQIFEARISSGNGPTTYLKEIRCKDGSAKTLEFSSSKIHLDGGPAVLAVVRDVSEKIRQEMLVMDERAKAQRYLDCARVMMVALDREGCVEVINRMGCETLGYGAEEMIGKDWFDNFLPERIRCEVRQVFDQLICEGDVKSAQWHHNPVLTRSGEERLIEWHNSYIRDEEGRITNVISSGLDITEQQAMQDVIRSRLKTEHAVAGVSRLLASSDISNLNVILGILGSAFSADLCVLHFRSGSGVAQSYDWTSGRAKPCLGSLEAFDLSGAGWLMAGLGSRGRVVIDKHNPIPPHARAERSLFSDLAVHSLLLLPISVNPGQVSGFLGLGDSAAAHDWSEEDIQAVAVIADIVSSYLRRRLALEELEESESRLRVMLDSIGSGVMIIDVKSRMIQDVNRAALEILDAKKEDMVGKGCHELICPVLPGGCPIIDAGMPYDRRECRLITAAGQTIPVMKSAAPLVLGGRQCLIECFTDLSELRKVQAEVDMSRRKLDTIFEHSPNSIVVFSLKGEIIDCNASTARMLGFESVGEIIGKSGGDFLSSEQQVPFRERVLRLLAGEDVGLCEFTFRRPDGHETNAECSMCLINDDLGKPCGMLGIASDISDRKVAEQEREELHRKAKERLVLIQKQNIKMMMLQRKLKEHSKRLETKVRRLEKSRISLNEKERLVLFGLCAYPDLNDRELAGKIGLNRSTITSIKNRLSERKLFRTAYMPDLSVLGYNLLVFMHGSFDGDLTDERVSRNLLKNPMLGFVQGTAQEFFCAFPAKNLALARQTVNGFRSAGAEVLSDNLHTVFFPIGPGESGPLFDYSALLKSIFGLDAPHVLHERNCVESHRLTKNMKEIMYALTKHPDITTASLAKMTRLAGATVISIRNRLLDMCLLRKVIIPDLRQLNVELLVFSHLVFNHGTGADQIDALTLNNPVSNDVLRKYCEGEFVSIRGYMDESLHNESVNSLLRAYNENNLLLEEPFVQALPLEDVNVSLLDFSQATKEGLGIDIDY